MWNYGNREEQDKRDERTDVVMKSTGLAIFFGLMPGAGHMYLGKMKRGMTLMLLFWGDIALSATLSMGILLMALPVIWFYAFFDNLNLASYSPERLAAAPDEFFFGLFNGTKVKELALFRKQNALLGWGCVFIGAVMLFNLFARSILEWVMQVFGYDYLGWLWEIYYKLPQMLVAILVIILGVHFMKGGKKQASNDEITPYRGE